MTAGRSGIPKVVGILMIIFASLGLLFGLIGLAGNSGTGAMDGVAAWKTFRNMSLIFGIIGLGISVLHLVAGIQSIRYKANAPKLAVAYGALNIVSQITFAVLFYAWLKPALDKVPGASELIGGMLVISLIIGVTWPIIVLALMTRPGAKAACTN